MELIGSRLELNSSNPFESENFLRFLLLSKLINIMGSRNVKELFIYPLQKYNFSNIAPRLELYGSRVELDGDIMGYSGTLGGASGHWNMP